MQIKHIYLLIFVVFVGCGYLQTNIPQNKVPQDKVSEENPQDGILFKGENIIILESSQSNLAQFPFLSPKSERCFLDVDKKIKSDLPSLGFKGTTKYFTVRGEEKDSPDERTFTLKLPRETFERINLKSLEKFDSETSFLDSTRLYLLVNKDIEYLLMIGHDKATSGYGHYYRIHHLLPLSPNIPAFKFSSLTTDPRKVVIDDSGTVYYVQIESKRHGAIEDADSDDDFPSTVSLYMFGGAAQKKLEFDFVCRNMNETFDK